MKTFEEIDAEIPYITEGDEHEFVVDIYDDVRIKQPGKYSDVTKGGDFVVETKIADKWVPLRHHDFFMDMEKKSEKHQEFVLENYMTAYLQSLQSDEIDSEIVDSLRNAPVEGYDWQSMLRTMQVISVAEFRRYPTSEPLGGRYLLFRFLLGIACDCWDGALASSFLKQGKPGLKMLRWKTGNKEPTLKEFRKGLL